VAEITVGAGARGECVSASALTLLTGGPWPVMFWKATFA